MFLAGVIWFLLIAVASLSVYFLFTKFFDHKKLNNQRVKKIVNVAVVAVSLLLVLTAIFSSLFYNFPSYETTVIIKENGDLKIYPHGNVFCWEFGNNFCFYGKNTISSPPTLTCSKASNFAYSVTVIIDDIKSFYDSLSSSNKKYIVQNNFFDNMEKGAWVDDVIKRIVKYYLYDFNQEHAEEFMNFFNPLDDSQQKQFMEMIQKYLAPKLKKRGIAIKSTNFTLEKQ
jgi:hypothetical protein